MVEDTHNNITVDINHNHDLNCDSVSVKGGLNNNGTNINVGTNYNNCDGNHASTSISLNQTFDNGSISINHSQGSLSGNQTNIGFDFNF